MRVEEKIEDVPRIQMPSTESSVVIRIVTIMIKVEDHLVLLIVVFGSLVDGKF